MARSIDWNRLTRYIFFVTVGAVFFWLATRGGGGPERGTAAADFALRSVAGSQPVTLQEHKGDLVFVEVFASWCPSCERMAPALADLAEAEREREVHFIGVSVDDSLTEARRAKREWNIPYEVALGDRGFTKAYQIETLPTFMLIDGQGRVREVATGTVSRSRLESWLSEAGARRL